MKRKHKARHKRRAHLHIMMREGFWWMGGRWVPNGTPIPPDSSACNVREFRTLKALTGAFLVTPAPCYVEANYHASCRRGKGWKLKYYAKK